MPPSYVDNAVLAIVAIQCLISAIRGGRVLDVLHLKALGRAFGEEIRDVDGFLPPTGFQAEIAVINLEGILSTLRLEIA